MEQNIDASAPITSVVENKQKSDKGLKIVIAIACVVAIFGIGFGVYGMMRSAQKDDKISDLEVQLKDKIAKIDELETKISVFDSETEEVAIDVEATTATNPDATSQGSGNNNSGVANILLGEVLDKNDSRTVFRISDCTVDGPSVKCPVTVDGKDALISYNSNDSILRLSLPNN